MLYTKYTETKKQTIVLNILKQNMFYFSMLHTKYTWNNTSMLQTKYT